MKKYIVIAAVMLVSVLLFVYAFQCTLHVENKSGKPIDRIEISVGGEVVLTKDGLADDESVSHSFRVKRGKRINIELTLGNSCVSRGTIEPGAFANIEATVDADGEINFGSTRFEHSQVIIGSW